MARQHVHDSPRERILHGLPVEQRQLDIDGTATSVLEGGQGSPFVLLHGGIQAGGVVWWRVVRQLAGRHRLVIPDLPGLGDSEPLARLDAASVAAWLAALVQRTCIEPPTLVAHSAPGGLAARFAADHSGLLRRLVLVDAAGLGSFRPSPRFVAALLRSNLR
ncbi:MAG: alpha/beta hydrolase, partial [Actinomycetota bacterium]|nr:alpha/beta hydrolase [Actinomycetota bacterium]